LANPNQISGCRMLTFAQSRESISVEKGGFNSKMRIAVQEQQTTA
jgi:hypothetical protein